MDEEPSIQRRLAADIAGYSRLLHDDEAATVQDLKAHQSVILPLIGQHGLIQKFLGHAKLETIQVYAESSTEMMRESYQHALGREGTSERPPHP